MYFFKDRLDNYFLELYIDLINQLFFFFSFLFFFFFFLRGDKDNTYFWRPYSYFLLVANLCDA
jgi:hypothetical protein